MKFAKIVFLVAGIYGIVVIAPLFLAEGVIDATQPPAITHPESGAYFSDSLLPFPL
jgi:hypothetical protein